MSRITELNARLADIISFKSRNYKKEYTEYHGKPAQIKRRAGRNAARAKLEYEGRVEKGDGKDVNHKDSNTTNNSLSNLRVEDKSVNRARKLSSIADLVEFTTISATKGLLRDLRGVGVKAILAHGRIDNPLYRAGTVLRKARTLGEPHAVRSIELKKLISPQATVHGKKVQKLRRVKVGSLPIVEHRGGGYYSIMDGNHRAAAELLNGKRKIKVSVL